MGTRIIEPPILSLRKVKVEKKPDPRRPELPMARRHVWAPANGSMLSGSPGVVNGFLGDVFNALGDGRGPYYVVTNGYDSRKLVRFAGVVSPWQLAKVPHGRATRAGRMRRGARVRRVLCCRARRRGRLRTTCSTGGV